MPRGVAWPQEEVDRWREFLADPQRSYKDAEKEFGVPYKTIHSRVPDSGLVRVTPEILAEWDKLLEDGYAYKHIAEIYHVAKSTVQRQFPGRGWTQEQIVAHGTLVRNGNRALRRVLS